MKFTNWILRGTGIIALLFFLGSCNQPRENNENNGMAEDTAVDHSAVDHSAMDHSAMNNSEGSEITKAICVLHPTEGNNVKGTVTFTKTDDGKIQVQADMQGLTEGKHGFHVHQLGDCSAADGTSAGGHFNPEDMDHGGPEGTHRHVGDLGNITADANGNASLQLTDDMISFSGKHSIIGRAIIVHAGEDDLSSQPTGDAGARVACGVIGIAAEDNQD